ncbi:hypothetical protein L6452_27882 [Arctium lappa]|uniref:Uncharacterized protein n=1 Tax=Arctium lappa TaxID=4217 RepID=A0ACB8ZWQ5_ARCLA|nr:hypothetical protein L6452_27882 [Arctium lappa]
MKVLKITASLSLKLVQSQSGESKSISEVSSESVSEKASLSLKSVQKGMDKDLFRSVNVGTHVPMVLVPRVPATADTAEIPAYYEKKTTNFTDEETNMMDNDSKIVRLLIMAIPNDIFQELDSCKTAKEIWDQFTPYSDQKGTNFNNNDATQQSRPQQPFQPTYPLPQRYFKPQEQKPETSTATLPTNQNDGRCFRCGKLGHFSTKCRGKLVKDQDYYKNKYKYNVKERVLVAEMEDWLSDSTSDGEEEPTNLCGMAFSDGNQTDGASGDNSEKVNSLYTSDSDPEIDAFKLINELQDLEQKFLEEKKKREQVTKELIFFKREKNLLESDKKEFFLEKTKLEETHKQKEKSFSEEIREIEKVLKGKEEEVKKSEYERLNSIALTKFFQKEREILHQSLDRKNLRIKSYVNAQGVFNKIKTQMDSQGLGFNELNSFTGLEKTSLSSTFCMGKIKGETSEVLFTKPQSNDPKEIFRFDAFISNESETSGTSTSDTSTSENESQSSLNPDATLYSPSSDENIRTTFEDDVKKIWKENVMEDLKRKESMKRIIKSMPIWYLYSGCSRHMTGDKELLSSFKAKSGGAVTFGDNMQGQIKGYGELSRGNVSVSKVAYVDGLKHNLISISQLCDHGFDVKFQRKYCSLLHSESGQELLRADRKDLPIKPKVKTTALDLCTCFMWTSVVLSLYRV